MTKKGGICFISCRGRNENMLLNIVKTGRSNQDLLDMVCTVARCNDTE